MVQSMNKKGQLPDMFLIIVVISLFAITTVVMVTFYDSYTDSLEDNQAFNNSWNTAIEANADNLNQGYDYLFMFILIGLAILTIVLGVNVRSHPVFFFISLLLLVIVTVVSAIFSDIYTKLATNSTSAVEATASTYTIIPYVMAHLPMFMFFLGMFIMILFYAKEKFMEDMG
jgi:hypothetical protein